MGIVSENPTLLVGVPRIRDLLPLEGKHDLCLSASDLDSGIRKGSWTAIANHVGNELQGIGSSGCQGDLICQLSALNGLKIAGTMSYIRKFQKEP